MLRKTLLYLSNQQKVFTFVRRNRLARRMASRFVAGETIEDAMTAVRALNARGITASLDLLGESVHRAGLRSQDAIFIQALVNDIGSAASAPREIGGKPVERRSTPRTPAQRHDSSRLVGRAMEFASFGLVATALALTAFGSVEQALASPLSQISAALD